MDTSNPRRDHLVFVRAGANSLHAQAIREDPHRNWDCFVSWYIQPQDAGGAEYQGTEGKNKLDAYLIASESTLRDHGYRYVFLLDDDIRFQPGDISRYLSICDRRRLALSQPSLAWGTHINHPVTLWNPVCSVREVGFVEVMAPCFSKEAMALLLPSFRLTVSTWGVDYAWAAWLKHKLSMSVVDAVQVEHTKQVDTDNGPFYQYMRRIGVDPVRECAEVVARVGGVPVRSTTGEHHCYRWRLPRAVNRRLMWMAERLKVRAHRRALQQKTGNGAVVS